MPGTGARRRSKVLSPENYVIMLTLSPLESNDFILHYLDIYLLVFFLSVGTLIKSNNPVVGPHTRAGVNLH